LLVIHIPALQNAIKIYRQLFLLILLSDKQANQRTQKHISLTEDIIKFLQRCAVVALDFRGADSWHQRYERDQ